MSGAVVAARARARARVGSSRGSRDSGGSAGVHTLTKRQSSSVCSTCIDPGCCGHVAPNVSAACVVPLPQQRPASPSATGGLQRRAKTGGAAYGMPLNTEIPAPSTTPETSPHSVKAVGADAVDAAAAEQTLSTSHGVRRIMGDCGQPRSHTEHTLGSAIGSRDGGWVKNV